MKYMYSLIFLLIGIGTPCFEANAFPYQKPHRFISQARAMAGLKGEYVSGRYYVGELKFYRIPCGTKLYFKGDFGTRELLANAQKEGASCSGRYNIFEPFTANTEIKLNNSNLIFTDNGDRKGLIVIEKVKNLPYPLIDKIIIYLYNESNKVGSKGIIDIDGFEKFITQTYQYNRLSKHEVDTLGLNISIDYPDFTLDTDEKKTGSINRFEFAFNGKEFRSPYDGWVKDKNFLLQYNDLAPFYKVSPMTKEEIAELLKHKF